VAKETYVVFGKKCRTFRKAAQKVVDASLSSKESEAVSVYEEGRLTAYIVVTASLEPL
jgi:hypothetical protein